MGTFTPGAWAREIYTDGSPFAYTQSQSYTAAGAPASPERGAAVIVPEECHLALSLITTTCSAKIQVSRSNRSQVLTGVAFWEDVTSLTGIGASAKANEIEFGGITAYRLYIDTTAGGGGTATLRCIAIPSANILGRGTRFEVMTPKQGYAELYVNGGAGASVYGEIVEQDAAVDYEVTPCPTSSQACKGYTYSNAVPVGAWELVVCRGHAEALLEDGVAAALGQIVLTSTATVGRVTTAAPPGAVAAHFREGGHVLAAKGAGVNVLVPVEIHWL